MRDTVDAVRRLITDFPHDLYAFVVPVSPMRTGMRATLKACRGMYKAFFGLHSTPFNLSPDPSFLYRSVQHEEALASLIYGVQSRKGFIVLTGEVGTGKTTMLECLRDHLTAHHTPFAFLFNSRLTPDQFFEMIAYDFDLPCARTFEDRSLIRAEHHADPAGQPASDHGSDRR